MYEQHLTQAGLTKNQASLYEALIKNGPLSGGDVAYKAKMSRPLAYKVLDELIALGLVERDEKNTKVARFVPRHPNVLVELTEKRRKQADTAEKTLSAILGQMSSDFNMIAGRPNVRFFEGMDGLKKVLEDSLATKGEILSYTDIETIQKYFADASAEYVRAREERGIKKRRIVVDTPFAREFVAREGKVPEDIRFIKHGAAPFQTVMQIYGDTVSYITLDKDRMIGVIIEDAHIARMHRYLFEYTWGTAIHAYPNNIGNLSEI